MYIILALISILILFGFALPSLSLAPWVPARKSDLQRILKIADPKPNEVFYDLGCGNGRVSLFIARESKCTSMGIELSFFFYTICLLRNIFQKNKAVFKLKNLYNEDLGGADIVFLFAQSREKISGRLKDKLQKELRKGSRVISYVFPFENWEAAQVSKPQNNDFSIYLYKI